MGAKTSIEWTATVQPDGKVTPGASWNPIAAFDRETGKRGWFCYPKSPGCALCYAGSLNEFRGTGHEYSHQNLKHIEYRIVDKILTDPIRWQRPRKIFVCSMMDLFLPEVTDEMRDKVFAVMAMADRHIFLVLTKWPENASLYFATRGGAPLSECVEARIGKLVEQMTAERGEDAGLWAYSWNWPLPNVAFGITAEDQRRLDERWPHARKVPARWRWLSYEPALGPIYVEPILSCPSIKRSGLDWIVGGGESGGPAQNPRASDPDWFRSVRDQCARVGVPFTFKQWGDYIPHDQLRPEHARRMKQGRIHNFDDERYAYRVGKAAAGRVLDGRTYDEHPFPL